MFIWATLWNTFSGWRLRERNQYPRSSIRLQGRPLLLNNFETIILWNCFPTFTSIYPLLNKVEPELQRKFENLRQTKCHLAKYLTTESIGWFMEDQALSPSYDLAPPPPPPLPHQLSRLATETERERQLLMGEGRGLGEKPNYTRVRKPGPL